MTTRASAGFVNARDIGGLLLEGGGHTRRGVLYRSEIPLHGDPLPEFDPWPPATVCDLRSAEEQRGGHPLDTPATTMLVTPLLADRDPTRLAAESHGLNLIEIYAEIFAACGDSMVRIAEAVATSRGPTLIHCAGGKDRTGVAIAILLAAVGVCRTEIVRDFLITAQRLRGIHDRLVAAEPPANREAFRERLRDNDPWASVDSPTAAIAGVLDGLESHDGGAGGWLMRRGLVPAHIAALRARLVDEPSG